MYTKICDLTKDDEKEFLEKSVIPEKISMPPAYDHCDYRELWPRIPIGLSIIQISAI